MTAQTRTDELLLALVAAWSAAPAIVALPKCRVYDGPFVTDLSSRYRLFVGASGLADDEEDAITYEQVSPHAANVARDETAHITCAAWYADGSNDMAAARANARTLLDTAVGFLRTDPGLSLPNMFYGGMDAGALRQLHDATGAAAVYTFVLRFTGRIY